MAVIPSNQNDLLSMFNSLGGAGSFAPSMAAGVPLAPGTAAQPPAAFANPVPPAVQEINVPAFQPPQAGGATVGGGQLKAGAADKDTRSLADRVPKFKFQQLQQLGGAGTGVGTTGKGGTNSGAHAQKAGAGIAAAAAGVEAGLAASAAGAGVLAAAGEGALIAILALI